VGGCPGPRAGIISASKSSLEMTKRNRRARSFPHFLLDSSGPAYERVGAGLQSRASPRLPSSGRKLSPEFPATHLLGPDATGVDAGLSVRPPPILAIQIRHRYTFRFLPNLPNPPRPLLSPSDYQQLNRLQLDKQRHHVRPVGGKRCPCPGHPRGLRFFHFCMVFQPLWEVAGI
jgi:hypothetical protein